jgi:hypothetical protein
MRFKRRRLDYPAGFAFHYTFFGYVRGDGAMGYWEQIGEANIRHRERRAKMHPRQRFIRDAAATVVIIVVCAALWALNLAPLWRPIAGWFAGAN